jgi:isopenicillin N synthase-like dioxygenase
MMQKCHDLHVLVMRSIALGLELDEHFFDKYNNEQCHNLRLLSYPPIPRDLLEGEGKARAGAHSGPSRLLARVTGRLTSL